MRDLVPCWHAEECESIWCGGEVREEPEEIFCIQFCAIEGASDVHAALDVGRKNGGIDRFRL